MIIRAILLLSLLAARDAHPAHAPRRNHWRVRPSSNRPSTFWRRVYTEITTNEGFVHDDHKLDIVYETVRLSNANDQGATLVCERSRRRYVRALRAIAARQARQPDLHRSSA